MVFQLLQQRQKQQQNSYGSNGAVRFELGEEEDGAGDDMELGSDFDPDEDLVKPGDELDEEREVDEDAERRRAFQNILESKYRTPNDVLRMQNLASLSGQARCLPVLVCDKCSK